MEQPAPAALRPGSRPANEAGTGKRLRRQPQPREFTFSNQTSCSISNDRMGPRHPAPFRRARLPRSREIDLQPLKRSPRAAATSEGGNRAKFVQNSFPWREQRRNAKSGRHHRALSRLSTRGAVAGPPRVYADHHPKFVHGRDENSFRSRSRTRDLIAHRKNHTLYIFGCFSEAKKHR